MNSQCSGHMGRGASDSQGGKGCPSDAGQPGGSWLGLVHRALAWEQSGGGALDEGSKPTKTEGRHMVAGAGLGVTKDTRKLLGVMGLRVDLILVRVPQDYVHLGKNLSNCTL